MSDATTAATIRTATPADAPRLAELSGVLGYPVSAAVMAQRLQRLLDRLTDVVMVAQLASREIVGWIHGSEQELMESGRRCEILGLVVDQRHRGEGIGRHLVQSVEHWAQGRGIEQITVRSNIQRTESHPFYERLGYQRVKTQHAYRKPLPSSRRG